MPELTPEEKRTIYEEEKERIKAQEKIKKKTKPATWGCLILIIIIGIIWLAGVFSPSKRKITPTRSAVQVKKAIPRITQEDEDLLRKLIESGLVEKINPQLNEVFVNPIIWENLKYEAKKDFAGFLAVYCGRKKGSGVNWVDIKDSYTGKKLAKCSDLGFKVY
jgi:hypothetical protein